MAPIRVRCSRSARLETPNSTRSTSIPTRNCKLSGLEYMTRPNITLSAISNLTLSPVKSWSGRTTLIPDFDRSDTRPIEDCARVVKLVTFASK